MYKNKFFDKIGYKGSMYEEVIYGMKKDDRNKIWKKQRKKYGGWDSRSSWNLDALIIETLYTWLSIYLKEASRIVNLSFYTFDIDGKTLTQEQCIRAVLKKLKYLLLNSNSMDKEIEEKKSRYRQWVFKVLGIILPYLWW